MMFWETVHRDSKHTDGTNFNNEVKLKCLTVMSENQKLGVKKFFVSTNIAKKIGCGRLA